MTNATIPPINAADDSKHQNLFAIVLNIFIQGLQGLGLLTLLLTALFFVRLIVANPLGLYHREVSALKSIQQAAKPVSSSHLDVTPPATGAVDVTPPTTGPATGAGPVGKKTSELTGPEIGIAGIATVELPPVVWLVICIIAAIFFVGVVEQAIRQLILSWQRVVGCQWTQSFWSFLGCLWALIWALIATIATILLIILTVLIVLFNIAAFIAIF